jgi:hypothetical protein
LIEDRNWFATPKEREELLKTNPKEIKLLRKHFRTGCPLGDEGFLIEAEKITGRELIPRKPGPKPKQR